jgi:hypothetical protein
MDEALRATRRVCKMSALMIIHDELLEKVSEQVDTMTRYPPNFEIKERYIFCSSAFLSWPEPSQGQILTRRSGKPLLPFFGVTSVLVLI